ncbi:MAG: NfeD family protein [Alphaproteobacteria bacterium]
MIIELVERLGGWSWVAAGLILLALEVLLPGTVFLWFGVAAILTGVMALVTDFGWQVDVIVFVVLAAGLVIVGRRVFSREKSPGERPFLNDRAQRLVGTSYILAEPIVEGKGRIRVDDTNWRVFGPDLPSGTRVRIASADGAKLVVEAE